jgi:hypothetical protein
LPPGEAPNEGLAASHGQLVDYKIYYSMNKCSSQRTCVSVGDMKKVAHTNSSLLSSGTNNSHRIAFIILDVKHCEIPFNVCDHFRLQTVCVQNILCQST